ncbi:MAG: hypothetical protein O2845_05580 [Proteobacteria bacterium]|nr:hypothetical protein [Pseudomonadota bacterium]
MRIIRPYGESHSEQGAEEFRRVLYDKTPRRNRHEIGAFTLEHDELVIAQWISTIDKIATKPQGNTGATPAQRDLRDKLGKAAWALLLLIQDKRLKLPDDARAAHLKALWDFKTHPYGKRNYRPAPRNGKTPPEPNPKGRWYQVFAGDVAVDQVDPEQRGSEQKGSG